MKNKLNFKIINTLLITVIIFLIYKMSDVWWSVVLKLLKILLPFFIAFFIAYIFNPIIDYFEKKKIPRKLVIFIMIISLLIISSLVIYYVVPLFVSQGIILITNLINFINNINIDDIGILKNVNLRLQDYLFDIENNVSSYIVNGKFLPIINSSINFITNTMIMFVSSIYFMGNMNNIRNKVKLFLKSTNKKIYSLVDSIDLEIYNYSKGLLLFMIVQFFEYTILFYLIGHPSFLLLGFLASVTTILPYFGGIATNILALLMASVISVKLFILTLLITLIVPNIDGYFISPKIYGKTNKINPLLAIFAVWAGSTLYGFMGILFALPATIVIIAIYKHFLKEINMKLMSFKESK